MLIPSFVESIEIMAKSSNIKTRGAIGRVYVKGLLIIYFSTFLSWVEDQSLSLDKTMNTLDNYLDRAASVIKLFNI